MLFNHEHNNTNQWDSLTARPVGKRYIAVYSFVRKLVFMKFFLHPVPAVNGNSSVEKEKSRKLKCLRNLWPLVAGKAILSE